MTNTTTTRVRKADGAAADGAAADGATPTMVGGRVAAVRGDTLLVAREDGSTTRVVGTVATSYTTLSRGRTATPGGGAVHAGDFVGVRGLRGDDGTVTASSVTVFTNPPFGWAADAMR